MSAFTLDTHGNTGLTWPLMPETWQPHVKETTFTSTHFSKHLKSLLIYAIRRRGRRPQTSYHEYCFNTNIPGIIFITYYYCYIITLSITLIIFWSGAGGDARGLLPLALGWGLWPGAPGGRPPSPYK